jgi:hypothetical protein
MAAMVLLSHHLRRNLCALYSAFQLRLNKQLTTSGECSAAAAPSDRQQYISLRGASSRRDFHIGWLLLLRVAAVSLLLLVVSQNL